MKGPIALPFVFLLIFLIALALFSVLDLFAAWGYTTAGTQTFTLAYAAQRMPRSLLQSLIPAVITALLFSGIRAVLKRVSRFLAFAIILVASYLVLVNGMFLLKGAAAPQGAAVSARLYAEPDAFFRLGGAMLNAHTVTDAGLKGVVVYRTDASGGERLQTYPSAKVTAAAGGLTVDFSSTRITGALPPNAGRLFQTDAFTAFFLRDMGVLTSDFQKLLTSAPGEFFLAAFALLFLCCASLAIMRFTRWPLVNALILIVAIRCYFLLYHFLSVTVRPEVTKGLTDPLMARVFPSAAFIVIGILLLIVDIIFIPSHRMGEGDEL